MKERPILFSAPMVRAILDGTKTQTRRVVKPQPERRHIEQVGSMLGFKKRHGDGFWLWPNAREHILAECPYGQPGDRLWVRESWAPDPPCDGTWGYTAWAGCRDGQIAGVPERFRHPRHCLYAATWEHDPIRWTPSIHMPRWASRITLEITSVRVERLQDISEADAMAEGARRFDDIPMGSPSTNPCRWSMETPSTTDECLNSARYAFGNYFCKVNGKDKFDLSPWDDNPWVWVVEFKMITQ